MLFEWLTGGGLYFDSIAPDSTCSIQKQGSAMLEAACCDLQKAGYQVTIPVDSRIELGVPPAASQQPVTCANDLPRLLRQAASESDFIWLIAPECEGCLVQCCDWLIDFADRFVSPDRSFISLTSCKNATAQRLEERQVPVPTGCSLSDSDSVARLPFPCVIKPRTGAGSEHIQIVDSIDEIHPAGPLESFRVETFVPGLAVSVSVLCGPRKTLLLPVTGQRFEQQPIGYYIGATWPLPTSIQRRAQRLAAATIAALPPTKGYLGIDMVIANAGPEFDCTIEVNPRLTMSYLKLREISEFNVAARTIEIATGAFDGGVPRNGTEFGAH